MSTCDELLATELMFSGVLNELEPSRLAALLSCLVVEGQGSSGSGAGKGGSKEGGSTGAQLRTVSMREPFEQLKELARRIATVVEEARLPIEIEDYVNKSSPMLVDIVIEWCGGAKFADIARMSDEYEGSIIRALHRLEELLRQLIDAAKVRLHAAERVERRLGGARTPPHTPLFRPYSFWSPACPLPHPCTPTRSLATKSWRSAAIWHEGCWCGMSSLRHRYTLEATSTDCAGIKAHTSPQ